jgi:hypothetical protein
MRTVVRTFVPWKPCLCYAQPMTATYPAWALVVLLALHWLPRTGMGSPGGEAHPYSQDPMLNPSLESQHSIEQQRSLSFHLHSPTLQGWFSFIIHYFV